MIRDEAATAGCTQMSTMSDEKKEKDKGIPLHGRSLASFVQSKGGFVLLHRMGPV